MTSAAKVALRFAILAALVHGLVVSFSLVPGWRAIPLLDGDAPTYLRPAENLVGLFAFSGAEGPRFSGKRTARRLIRC